MYTISANGEAELIVLVKLMLCIYMSEQVSILQGMNGQDCICGP